MNDYFVGKDTSSGLYSILFLFFVAFTIKFFILLFVSWTEADFIAKFTEKISYRLYDNFLNNRPQNSNEKLGHVLLKLGLVSENNLINAYSEQMGHRAIELEEILNSNLDVTNLLSEDFAKENKAVLIYVAYPRKNSRANTISVISKKDF